MVNRDSFTDFNDSVVLLFVTIDWLIVFLFRIMNWNCPGLAIMWLPLTHFQPMFHFYTHRKHQKTEDFLIFSGGIGVEHSSKMG